MTSIKNHLNVSTIIPTYNRAHVITRAVASAIRQSKSGDEIIVVDDGSTDDTESRLKPYMAQIRYIKTDNKGAGHARNCGIDAADNPLVAFLDSDDEWMENSLDIRRCLMESNTDILFCFSDMAVTHANGCIEHRYIKYWHNDTRPWSKILSPGLTYTNFCDLPADVCDFDVFIGDMYINLARANYIFTSTLMVRKDTAGDALFFEPDIPTYEDWVCFGRLAKKGNAAYLDIETAWQHGDCGNRLTSASAITNAETRLFILNHVWGKDEHFLHDHREYFDRLLYEQRLFIIKELITLGRTPDARQFLKQHSGFSIMYHILATLPGWLAKSLWKFKQRL